MLFEIIIDHQGEIDQKKLAFYYTNIIYIFNITYRYYWL